MSASYPKVYLKSGVVCSSRPTSKGRPIMPKITNANPPKKSEGFSKEDMIEMAKAMAKEMAQEMSKNIPQQIVVSNAGVPQPVGSDTIELESGFIDPTELENFSVNLDNIETKTGESIAEKMKKLKALKGES